MPLAHTEPYERRAPLNDVTEAEQPGPMKSARYTLGLLLVIYVVNQIDRQIMNILIEPVKNDLSLDDTQMGWLVGGAFAIFYTFAGFPIARMADRGNRRNIITLALFVWSAMTIASGLARNFIQLMAARIAVGIGEAGCTPPAHSILSDSFPPERRATAISVYSLGVPIGMLFGLAFGGFLADELGWQMAFFIVGTPGIALALLTRLTLTEPERGTHDSGSDASVESLGETLGFMLGLPSMRQMLLGCAAQTLCLAGIGAFHASFLVRVHELSLTQAGIVLGLISGLAGSASIMAAGWLADRLGAHDLRWYWWIPAAGALLSIPFGLVAYTTDDPRLSIAMIACATLANHTYSGLGHAVMQNLAKPRMRAMTSATALFVMNLVGFGLGPIVLGALSDHFGGGAQIRYALVTLLLFLAWASLHYLWGARSYRKDLEAKAT
jgi:predicted MFS family arabinose efflux permease